MNPVALAVLLMVAGVATVVLIDMVIDGICTLLEMWAKRQRRGPRVSCGSARAKHLGFGAIFSYGHKAAWAEPYCCMGYNTDSGQIVAADIDGRIHLVPPDETVVIVSDETTRRR